MCDEVEPISAAPGGDDKIDAVRASRDGHQFHEAWAARSALELLPPDTSLVAIAIEGFSREDEESLSQTATEVADLVRYYGATKITEADRLEIVQFKYSIARADKAMRASDLKKTLTKFAKGEAERIALHGAAIAERAHYELSTNRPIDTGLRQAVEALASGSSIDGDASVQCEQVRQLVAGFDIDVCSFAQRLTLLGGLGSLKESRHGLRSVIANWSAPGDPQTRMRLRGLESLVRDKAGSAGQRNNIIDRVTLLAEFGIDDERELYPTEDAFPEVGDLIVRPILDDVGARAKAASLPLVLHAEGGVGKTVLMQALADRLGEDHAVVLFDGYGAGKWREPSNPRHLPSRTFVHLANMLAGRGLCDLLIPPASDDALLRALRLRLADAVRAVRQTDPQAGVALILDAIDHAAIVARDTNTVSFAHLLLKSLSIDPIPGVILVASCRPERLAQSIADAEVETYPIPVFSPEEATQLILARDPAASSEDIATLMARSGRNPRCLAAFLTAGRPYDNHGPQAGNAGEILDSLLLEGIASARREASLRGATDAETSAMLAGLAMLPPPVPLDELAAAQGLSVSDVESFATDLAPLLERTRHGLMFRDEPTETLIGKMSQDDPVARATVIERLVARQSTSDYAARALPQVLTAMDDVDRLVELAFDPELPVGASEIGKREIRLARIIAALRAAAHAKRTDDLFRLALEASLVAAGHERADRFLYEHPDLVAISRDSEAMRRLFATKTGWPGGRHSALAVAYAFSGEFGEAERNAARAIDWQNQRSASSTGREERPAGPFDQIGFSYVQLLAGDQRRIFSWLARNGDAFAFDIVDEALALGDRHAKGGVEAPDMVRVRRALARCPFSLRGAFLAALNRSDGDRERDLSFIRRLGAAPAREGRSTLGTEPLLVAAMRAADLGLRADAKTISGWFDARANTVFSFDDHRSSDLGAVHALISAGLIASLKRRKTALIDIAPSELVQMVPKSLRNRGPAAFERELVLRLDGPGFKPAAKRGRRAKWRQTEAWQDGRYERQKRLLKSRVRPALDYADRVREMLSATSEGRKTIVKDWLTALEKEAATAARYPYHERAGFITRAGSFALLLTASVLQTFDQKSALRLAKLMVGVRDMPVASLLWGIERLSWTPNLHRAVMLLASRAEQEIRAGVDTSTRLNNYGRLARAVWMISPDDAAAYFRRGLDLAEALGADDFERANSMLQLAPNYKGPPLSDRAAHALPRIFELQFSDADRYPWVEWAQATHGVLGLGALPAAARMDDRDTATLTYTLAPTLSTLTSANMLSADLALALTCLAPQSEGRGWRFDKLVAATLPRLAPAHHERLFEIILREIDREDGLSPCGRTIDELNRLAKPLFSASHWIRRRLAALRSAPTDYDEPPMDDGRRAKKLRTRIAFGDAHAIDEAIIASVASGKGYQWPKRVLQSLVAKAAHPQERLALLKAFPTIGEAALDGKLVVLDPVVRGWAEQSPAVAEALDGVAQDLIAHHAEELVGTGWEVTRSWRHLVACFSQSRDEIAMSVVAGLGPGALEMSGEDWLSLAAEASPAVSQAGLGNGLDRFLIQVGSGIPDEIGDGPWGDNYTAPDDEVAVAAGLIWARLGNRSAAMRWRAGHAIYELARVGRFDVINALVALYDRDAGAFADRALPFFRFNAKLWLLLGVGRVARDYPAALVKHGPFLEQIACSADFPHPAIREAALRALRSILKVQPQQQAAVIKGRLKGANRSPFSPYVGKPFYFDAHDMPPAGRRDPDARFTFDYDFQKYQVAEVARLFRVDPWKIRERIAEIVRTWAPDVSSMYYCPHPHYENDQSSSWSGGYVPGVDRYGGYLAWHALQVTAGELLAKQAVTKTQWSSDTWGGFLQANGLSLKNGAWLAEWTDLTPVDVGTSMPMPSKEHTGIHDPGDEALLAAAIGLEKNAIGSRGVVVAGYWSAPGGVGMYVNSLVAPATIARAALLAGLMVDPFFRGLPTEGEYRSEFPGYNNVVRCWLDTNDHEHRALDRYDPFAASDAQGRASPGLWLREEQGISRADVAGRLWLAGKRVAFEGQAWGGPETRLDRHDKGGDWVKAKRGYLASLLSKNNLVLAGIVQARLHIERDDARRGRTAGEGRFVHRTLGYLVDGSGRVVIPKRVPSAIRQAVDALDRRDRHDYPKRFRVVLKALRESDRR